MVYLDYAASAPTRPEAHAAERAYDEAAFAGANPNALHGLGREASRALDGCRARLASLVGGRFRPQDVVFTSGGTENNNLALLGLAAGARERGRRRTRVIVSAIEHDSVLDVGGPLRERGFAVETVGATRDGVVEAEGLRRLLSDDVALVSVMYANNETGVIQPIDALARLAHRAGALFYADCAQGFGKVKLDVGSCDAIGICGHKVGAPVGTGALLVRSRVPLRPQTFGGGQERGIRPGTQDVRGAMALTAAAEACHRDLAAHEERVRALAIRLYARVCTAGSGIAATVDPATGVERLFGIVSLIVSGVDSESLVLGLDERGFCVSAASACSSGSLDASHVLLSMGVPRNEALGSLRVSFDERVDEADLDAYADALLDLTRALRARR